MFLGPFTIKLVTFDFFDNVHYKFIMIVDDQVLVTTLQYFFLEKKIAYIIHKSDQTFIFHISQQSCPLRIFDL